MTTDEQLAEQLKDIIIIIASAEVDDDGDDYAVTQVYRGDLEGPIDEFITSIKENKQLARFSQMKNK